MKTTTTIYTVSTFNETPINTIEYKGYSRYEADLKTMELIRQGKHGIMLERVTTENKEYNYYNEQTNTIKTF